MPAPAPAFIPRAFAQNAAAPFRNVIPLTTATPGRASFDLGFPPLTMQPVISGGKPPLGQDVNGVLYMVSSHTVYQQSGQPYRWSADVAAAIGGYAPGTILGSTDGVTLWFNIVADNVTNPDGVAPVGWVGMFSYGITSIGGLTGGVRTLSPAEAARGVIVLTGTLIANMQVVVPAQYRRWLIVNATTGQFSLTVRTPAGSGVAVPQGGFNAPVEVWSDGINVYNVVAPVNLPIDQAATGLTIAQRTNAGYLFATYFNQSSPLENFAMAAIYADGGDGYHRKIPPASFQAQLALSNFAGQVSNPQVPVGAVNQWRGTILDNSNLTGTPTAPTPSPGDNSARLATTAFVAGLTSIGLGQNWSNPGKNKNITYTNTGARPILVCVSTNVTSGGGNANIVVNGVLVCNAGNGSSADNEVTLSFIVPPGQTYRMNGTGSRTNVTAWAELV